jgi:hypothetical protein
MEKEFIVETKSGSLYRINYQKGFFSHGSRFTLRQLVGKTIDFSKDDYKVLFFGHSENENAMDNLLDLKHLKVNSIIWFHPIDNKNKLTRSSKILKIYELKN